MANKDRPVKLPGSFEETLSDLLKVKPQPKDSTSDKSVEKRARKVKRQATVKKLKRTLKAR